MDAHTEGSREAAAEAAKQVKSEELVLAEAAAKEHQDTIAKLNDTIWLQNEELVRVRAELGEASQQDAEVGRLKNLVEDLQGEIAVKNEGIHSMTDQINQLSASGRAGSRISSSPSRRPMPFRLSSPTSPRP